MSTRTKLEEKRNYVSPVIEQVLLDNEISLALESAPANGPNEGLNKSGKPECFHSDPFQSYLV